MKLREDAWDKPKGVSDETYIRYQTLYQDALHRKVAKARTFGLSVTDKTVIDLYKEALKKLKAEGPQETDPDVFRRELQILSLQISKNTLISSIKPNKAKGIPGDDFDVLMERLTNASVEGHPQEDTNENTGPCL